MTQRFFDGLFLGSGIVAVLAVAFLVAWAGDVFTIDKDGTPKFAVSDAGKITVGATESYVNLVVQNNGAAPTNKVDITADVLTVEGVRLENLNVSADITAAVGAGGRDTNFPDATGWYYIWVITNNTGTLVNGILTLAPATPNPPTPPTLPSGYTKYRRVGAVRNNASNDFLQFAQEGNTVLYEDPIVVATLANLGTATSFSATPTSASTLIPPTSRRGIFRGNLDIQLSSATSAALQIRPVGSSSVYGIPLSTIRALNTTQYFRENGVAECSLDASQNIEYRINLGGGGISAGGGNLFVFGYRDRI